MVNPRQSGRCGPILVQPRIAQKLSDARQEKSGFSEGGRVADTGPREQESVNLMEAGTKPAKLDRNEIVLTVTLNYEQLDTSEAAASVSGMGLEGRVRRTLEDAARAR
jgi:hypothetical protein